MPNLRLCRDCEHEPERDALDPIPFCAPSRPGEDRSGQEPAMIDPIAHAQAALEHADAKLGELNALLGEDIDDAAEPGEGAAFLLTRWLDDADDDGPWAA